MARISIKKNSKALVACFFLPLLVSWGVFGHEHINHTAVLLLPEPVRGFFYNHIDFITQESTVPDLRKYTLEDKSEGPRHYINLENYHSLSALPKTMESLKQEYDETFLVKNGVLPWYLKTMMDKLTRAFREKRKTEILFLAADLGHYIADAHMPLHTSSNHDGELTGQHGIHAFWEAQLPDLFGAKYNYKADSASYIANIDEEIWHIITSSHELVDTLLLKESALRKTFAPEKIYQLDSTGKPMKNKFGKKVHSLEYAKRYHTALNGMVEKQMRKAITATASFWYTAWINAGKPNLSGLDSKDLSERNALLLKEELLLLREGSLKPLESEKEF